MCSAGGAADAALSPDRKARATLLQRHHFSSHLKRMSAVLRVEDDGAAGASPYAFGAAGAAAGGGGGVGGRAAMGPQYVVVAKGAPEVLKAFLGECGLGWWWVRA